MSNNVNGIAVSIATTLALVACGSDGGSESPATPRAAPLAVAGPTTIDVTENTDARQVQYTVSNASSAGTSFTLTGPDAARFDISPQGKLIIPAQLDYEEPKDSNRDNNYDLFVGVQSGSTNALLPVTIRVKNQPVDDVIKFVASVSGNRWWLATPIALTQGLPPVRLAIGNNKTIPSGDNKVVAVLDLNTKFPGEGDRTLSIEQLGEENARFVTAAPPTDGSIEAQYLTDRYQRPNLSDLLIVTRWNFNSKYTLTSAISYAAAADSISGRETDLSNPHQTGFRELQDELFFGYRELFVDFADANGDGLLDLGAPSFILSGGDFTLDDLLLQNLPRDLGWRILPDGIRPRAAPLTEEPGALLLRSDSWFPSLFSRGGTDFYQVEVREGVLNVYIVHTRSLFDLPYGEYEKGTLPADALASISISGLIDPGSSRAVGVGDFTGDGVPDLLMKSALSPGSDRMELFVVSGARLRSSGGRLALSVSETPRIQFAAPRDGTVELIRDITGGGTQEVFIQGINLSFILEGEAFPDTFTLPENIPRTSLLTIDASSRQLRVFFYPHIVHSLPDNELLVLGVPVDLGLGDPSATYFIPYERVRQHLAAGTVLNLQKFLLSTPQN